MRDDTQPSLGTRHSRTDAPVTACGCATEREAEYTQHEKQLALARGDRGGEEVRLQPLRGVRVEQLQALVARLERVLHLSQCSTIATEVHSVHKCRAV